MKIVFVGTPDEAASSLHALVDAGHEVPLVITRPDKRRGRSTKPAPSPVKAAAHERSLPVSHELNDIFDVEADLAVVVAYGRIIKPEMLATMQFVNVHFSLLPRWRGAAPVERAVLAGDDDTGVCIMDMEEGLDTGGVYARRTMTIGDATAVELRAELSSLGARLLVETLSRPLGGPDPQSGEATYAAKITPEDLHIDWNRPAAQIARIPRVGKAWTTFRGKRFIIGSARAEPGTDIPPGVLEGVCVGTGEGTLVLDTVQPEARSALDATAWANGARLTASDHFE